MLVHGCRLDAFITYVRRVDLFDMSPVKGQQAYHRNQKYYRITYNNVEIDLEQITRHPTNGHATRKAALRGLRDLLRPWPSSPDPSSPSDEGLRALFVAGVPGVGLDGRLNCEPVAGFTLVPLDPERL
jgi:hypothetical protein